MDFKVCAQCGKEIEEQGVLFKRQNFCGDECCEEFEALMLAVEEPALADLHEDAALDDDDLDVSDDLENLDGLDENLDLDDDF